MNITEQRRKFPRVSQKTYELQTMGLIFMKRAFSLDIVELQAKD